VQYADYAAWQRRWVDGEVLRQQADYWTATLTGAPELLELPTDRPRPARQDYGGGLVQVVLDQDLTAALKGLGRRQGTTLFMTLLAGWAAVLGRLSGQEDVVVGTPTANRGRREIEGLIGFFINTLAVRVDLAGGPTVGEVLERVKTRALEAQQHQDIPFEQVVERVQPARSLAHSPLFQAMFAWQNAPRGTLFLPGLELAPVQGPLQDTVKFDLSLVLYEADGRIVGGLAYATSLFEQATAERFVGYLRRVLKGMVLDTSERVDRLDVLPEAERRQVVQAWNATEAPYPGESCLHELFEAQVERTPDATAVLHEERALTYRELNERANRLAHHLREQGVGPDVRVGICLERSPEMVVGVLATLKAGGAYVPLDPGYPEDRLGHMLGDSAPAVLLTQASLAGRFGRGDVPVLALDTDESRWGDRPGTNPGRAGLRPDHLAFVIYTSGSTGRPKGVMNLHRAMVNRLAWMRNEWRLEADGAMLQNSSISFDASIWEILLPLTVGARLVLARPEAHKDLACLVETIRSEGVTTLFFVCSMLQLFLEAPGFGACSGVRRVLCGGEPLSPGLARRFYERLPHATLHNLYGPSEAAVAVTTRVPDVEEPRVTIGRPAANMRVHVLDAAGEPVPVGVAGELYIGGVQLARGYLDRPELTAERFVPDRLGGEPGARVYRTGDLGRWLADGTIEFLGRNDFQVKVRGYRIEPGEVEARLLEHAEVREATVLAREDAAGDKRLVAYYVGGAGVGAEGLRAHLAERLPEYMVPAAYVQLESLPLTPSGKLDRRALPAPEGDAYARRAYDPPESETEAALAEIWLEVLGVERVGRHDHFFELGGHSLLASRLARRIKQHMEVDVALRDVFEKPVLSMLAQHVLDAQLAQFDPEALAHLSTLVGGSHAGWPHPGAEMEISPPPAEAP
jgi:amino acid adenylation domain-containing protein